MNCQDTLERLPAAESSSLPVMAVATASATVGVSIHDIEDIISNVKRKYLNVHAKHLKQHTWNLKKVAELQLVEKKRRAISRAYL